MNNLFVRFFIGICILLSTSTGAIAIEFNNSDFEAGTDGWIGGFTGGTIGSFSVDSDAYSGLGAAKLSVENDGYYMISNTNYPRVFKTGIYILDLYIKAAGTPENVNFALKKSNSPLTTPSQSVSSMIIDNLSTGYELHQLVDIPLTAGDCLRVEIGVQNSSSGTACSVWFDTLRIYRLNEELQNSIKLLRVLAGIDTTITYEDINNDNKLGLQEALYTLQTAAELRTDIYNPAGTWNGTLSGIYGSGQIINWGMMSDQTITGSIQYNPFVGGVTNINISTGYEFEANAFSFVTSGTAIYNHPQLGTMTTVFTMDVFGILSSDTEASGFFAIYFDDPNWTDESGTWNTTKN